MLVDSKEMVGVSVAVWQYSENDVGRVCVFLS